MTLDYRRALLWLAPLAMVLGGAPAAAEWRFQIPAGWVDLAGGKAAPPGMRAGEVAQAAAYQVYAVDPASADHGYPETMVAKIVPQAMVPDEKALGPFIDGFTRGVHRTAPGAQVSIVEQGIVEIQGVKAIRVVAEVTGTRKRLRTLQYALPGGDSTAVISYSADASAFARYLPIFEANVRAVQGAAQPPLRLRVGSWLRGTWVGDLSPDDREALFKGGGQLAGIVIVLVLFRLVRRRRQSPTP